MDKQSVAIYSHAIKEYSSLELWMHYATRMKPEGAVPVTYRQRLSPFKSYLQESKL